jgi:hypothetical protein
MYNDNCLSQREQNAVATVGWKFCLNLSKRVRGSGTV